MSPDAPTPCLLVVDDDPNVRTYMKALLRRAFPESAVILAESGEEGLDVLRSQAVDLVLSDHHLGAMDGVTLLTHARSLAPSTLRVLFTGHADGPTAQRAVNDGHVHAFFQKPVESALLVSTLHRLLEEQAMKSQTERAFARSLSLGAAIAPTAPYKGLLGESSGPRLLLVDDVPQVSTFLAELARRLPGPRVNVRACSDAREARRILETEPIDVVITDYRMPHVNGVDLLVHARKHRPHARRILITGYNEIPEQRERLVEASVDAYLHKPVPAQDGILLLRAAFSEDPAAMDAYRTQARTLERAASVADDRPLHLDET